MLKPGRILVIEDIAEPIYKVERILHQLRLNGVLENLSGLLVGQFTEYRGDSNYTDMERMIADMTAPYGYPVALGAPFGHRRRQSSVRRRCRSHTQRQRQHHHHNSSITKAPMDIRIYPPEEMLEASPALL